jgi:FlgD Ig-like domain
MDHGTDVTTRRRIPVLVVIALFGAFMLPLILAAPGFSSSCVVVDNGTGTADLPPGGCGYIEPTDLFKIINGLLPGDEIDIGAQLQQFFNVVRTPGGSLGGETEQFGATFIWQMNGTGSLSGFHRTLSSQVQCETHSAPRTPGTPVQSFDTDFFAFQSQLSGDPDFDLLRITAGTTFGMPSPGHTTLTSLPAGQWNVDSFFDITCRIDFIGHPGGALGGRSGSTTQTVRIATGQPVSTGVSGSPAIAAALEQNTPNPFNPSTRIAFTVSRAANALVSLDVFDVRGTRVRRLVHDQPSTGYVSVTWDGRNDAGQVVSSGVYFYRLTAGTTVLTRRMTLAK